MFTPVQNKKVYQQVVDQIQEMILSGTLKCGDRLPAEREMAELFQVSRTSVREAVRTLEILGLVETRQGGGNFIRERFDEGVLEPLSIMFKLNNGSFLDILETRKMLESEAATLAAARITTAQLAEMENIIDRLHNAENEKASSEYDAKFHYALIEASGNYLIISLYRAVYLLMRSFITDARKLFIGKIQREKLMQQHRNIFSAIADRDPARSSEEIRKHFAFVIDNLPK